MTALPRCPVRGCPVRWTMPGSSDHLCIDHSAEEIALTVAAAALGIVVSTVMAEPASPASAS